MYMLPFQYIPVHTEIDVSANVLIYDNAFLSLVSFLLTPHFIQCSSPFFILETTIGKFPPAGGV